MFSATDARYNSRTVEEANELWEIHKLIEAACKENLRFVLHKPFVSYMVSDILRLDYGYTITFGGDKGMRISW